MNAGGGILNAVVIVNGVVAGTWKRKLGKSVEIAISPFRELTPRDARAVDQAATRYRTFLSFRRRPAA